MSDEQTDEVARLFQDGSGGGAELHAHLPGQQHRQGGLSQAGRPEKQDMIEGFPALLCRVDGDLQRCFHLALTHELIQP